MRSTLIRTAVTAATLLASAGLMTGVVTATGSAAHADGINKEVDVVSISGNPVFVSSKTTTATLKLQATVPDTVSSWSIDSADVYRGSTKVGTLTNVPHGTTSVTATLQNSWGRGTFTLRNLALTVTTTDDGVEQYADNAVSGSTWVLSDLRGNLAGGYGFSILYSSHTKKFKAGLDYYSTSGWKHRKGAKSRIQEYTHGHWKTVKTLRLNSKGQGGWTRHTSKKYSYRMYTPGTSSIASYRTYGSPKLRVGR